MDISFSDQMKSNISALVAEISRLVEDPDSAPSKKRTRGKQASLAEKVSGDYFGYTKCAKSKENIFSWNSG